MAYWAQLMSFPDAFLGLHRFKYFRYIKHIFLSW